MANGRYNRGRQGMLSKEIDWDVDTIQAILIDTSLYTANLDTDEFFSDVPSGAIIASETITGATSVDGLANADTIVFGAVPAGQDVGAVVFYQDTGTDSTSILIAYFDDSVDIPLTPDGRDITLTFTGGIFQL